MKQGKILLQDTTVHLQRLRGGCGKIRLGLGPVPSRPRLTQALPCWWGRNHCAAFCERPWAHRAAQGNCVAKTAAFAFLKQSFSNFQFPYTYSECPCLLPGALPLLRHELQWHLAEPQSDCTYVIPCLSLSGSLLKIKMHVWILMDPVASINWLPTTSLSKHILHGILNSTAGLNVMSWIFILNQRLCFEGFQISGRNCHVVVLIYISPGVLKNATTCAQVAWIRAKCSLAWQCCLWEGDHTISLIAPSLGCARRLCPD